MHRTTHSFVSTYLEESKLVGGVRWPNDQGLYISNVCIAADNGDCFTTISSAAALGEAVNCGGRHTQIGILLYLGQLLEACQRGSAEMGPLNSPA